MSKEMASGKIFEKIKNFIIKHDEKSIFLTVFAIEIIFGLLLINKYGSVFFDLDSTSYLYNTRNVIDNGIYSGLATLVGTWLPVFEITQIPLVIIDKFYTTGFSGTIINAMMTGGIAVYLYKFLGGKDNKFAILMPIVFISNIYVLVFGAIPMTEQVATFFLIATAYYFKNYLDSGDTQEFMKCSFALILGTLTRYEIWFVAVFVVLVFLIREIILTKKIYKIGYAPLPLWGIFGWLFTNYMIHKDFLWFNDNPSSAISQNTVYPQYFKDSVLLTIKHAFIQMDMTFGILFYISIISIIFIILTRKTKLLIPLIIFSIPSIVNIVLMFKGQSAGWQRYFYTSVPGIILLTGILLENIPIFVKNVNLDIISKRTLILFAFIGIFAMVTISQSVQLNYGKTDIKDGLNSQIPNRPWIYQGLDMSNDRIFFVINNGIKPFVSDFSFEFLTPKYQSYSKIKDIIGDKKVLMPAFTVTDKDPGIRADMLSVSEGISPRQIVDGFDFFDYERIMKEPWNNVEFVVVSPLDIRPAENINKMYNGNFYIYNYYYNNTWKTEFLNHYAQVYEYKDSGDKIFKLKTNLN